MALLASTLALPVTGATGPAFGVATLGAGAWLIVTAFRVQPAPDTLATARSFFRTTLVYLPALAAGLLVDALLG